MLSNCFAFFVGVFCCVTAGRGLCDNPELPETPFHMMVLQILVGNSMALPSLFPSNNSFLNCFPSQLPIQTPGSLHAPPISGLSPACQVSLQRATPGCLPGCNRSLVCFLVVITSAASVFTLEPVAKVISWQLAKP